MRRKVKPKPYKPRGGPGLLGFAYAAAAYRQKKRQEELAAKLKTKSRRRHVV